MLLRFRVANHRSIRDEQELSLVAGPGHDEQVGADVRYPRPVKVAAIYGPNASGKSSVISAIHYFTVAVRDSYRLWGPTDQIPREPFLLNTKSKDEPSLFEVDFVLDGVRYNYGFELTSEKVVTEWLYSYPYGKRRVLFDRQPNDDYHFGRSLRGENSVTAKLTRPNALFLSVAAATSHGLLTSIYQYFAQRIHYVDSSYSNENARLAWLKQQLTNPEFAEDMADLLRLADLGVSGIELISDADPTDGVTPNGEDARRAARVEVAVEPYAVRPEGALVELQKRLGAARVHNAPQIELIHHTSDPKGTFHIPFQRESAGTKAWLPLAGRILFALRHGEALIVDEIDASLHPRLSATLIQVFKDSELNRRGAQLIFTTHDVSFLGTLLDEDLLSRDEVWFTEKGHDGFTTLYSLLDFKPRASENFERGYLQGRYGGLPIIDDNQIKRVVARVSASQGLVKQQEPAPRDGDGKD